MFMRNLRIFCISFGVFCLHSVVSIQHNVSVEIATVEITFKYSNDEGKELEERRELKVTGCTSPAPRHDKVYTTINNTLALSGCVNLYRRLDCKGDFISRTFGLSVDLNYWSDRYDDEVYSIGLCGQEFSPDDIEPSWPVERTPFVTFEGADSNLTLEVKECLDLPKSNDNETVKSISFNNTVCVELHEEENCTGRSVQYRQILAPRKVDMTFDLNAVKSVSTCGYNGINGSAVDYKFTPLGQGIVTLFEEEDFHGGYLHVNISQGCQEIVDENRIILLGQWKSILTYDEECVSIHSLQSCSSSSEDLLLNQTNLPVHRKLQLKLKSVKQCHQTESTRLYTIKDYGHEMANNLDQVLIDVTDCSSFSPYTYEASEFHTYNGCLNIYKQQSCIGPYLTLNQGITTYSDTFLWNGDDYYITNYIASVGPCECDSRSTATRFTALGSTVATLHGFTNGSNVSIAVAGCTILPRILQRNVEELTSTNDVCIQLHEFWNCTGRSGEHGNLGRQLHYLKRDEDSDLIATRHSSVLGWEGPVSSVSHCDYRCNISPSVPNYQRWNLSSPGPNIVTLFDEPHYNGNSVNLNLTNGCFEIREEFPEWEGQGKSIRTFEQCVIVYDKLGCTTFRDYGRQIVLNNTEGKTAEMIDIPVKSLLTCYRESHAIPMGPPGFFGDPTNLQLKWLNRCISLPNYTTENVDASHTCLNIYEEDDCRGIYAALRNEENHVNLFWKKGDENRNRVRSIGPCKCDPRSEEIRYTNLSISVTLYDSLNKRGNKVKVDIAGCQVIPRMLKRRVGYIEFHKPTDYNCVELHQFWNCTGQSVQYGNDSRQRQDIRDGNLYTIIYPRNLDSVGSISKCDYGCRTPEIKESNRSSPGPNIVRIFDEPNFNGDFEDLNLSTGCLNISKEWEGQFQSIRVFYECVSMHSTLGCDKSSDDLNLHYSKDQAQFSVSWPVRSIKLCQKEGSETTNVTLVIILPILALLVLTATVASVMFIRLRRVTDKLNEKEIQEFINGTETSGIVDPDDVLGKNKPYDQSYEIPRELLNIDIGAPLGSGAFAVVYKGHVKRPGGTEEFVVAVKTVKPYSGIEYTRALLKEIKTMIYVGNHDKILGLLGCCTERLGAGELFVMTELCENGCMEKFLRSNRESFVNLIEDGPTYSNSLQTLNSERMEPISPNYFNTAHLMKWCLQIAEGMDYLATKKVVHGDLATRNVLLDINFDIKISDFGLSRQLYQYSQYVKQTKSPLPWKWLAIETLRSFTFSTESDVWAFGVTAWEIFSLGDTPFPERIWNQNFLDSLTDYGLRLSRPKTAPIDWYDVILECWRERPSDRITFPHLRIKLAEILQKCYPSWSNGTEYMNIEG